MGLRSEENMNASLSAHMRTHLRRRPWRRPPPPPSTAAWGARRHATRHSAPEWQPR